MESTFWEKQSLIMYLNSNLMHTSKTTLHCCLLSCLPAFFFLLDVNYLPFNFSLCSLVKTVGTPPPDNTWHTFSSGSTSSGFSPRVHVTRLSYPDPLKERYKTLMNRTSGRLPQHIRTTDIRYLDMFVRIIDWSKASLTRYHNSLPWPTFRHLQGKRTRMKWQ